MLFKPSQYNIEGTTASTKTMSCVGTSTVSGAGISTSIGTQVPVQVPVLQMLAGRQAVKDCLLKIAEVKEDVEKHRRRESGTGGGSEW